MLDPVLGISRFTRADHPAVPVRDPGNLRGTQLHFLYAGTELIQYWIEQVRMGGNEITESAALNAPVGKISLELRHRIRRAGHHALSSTVDGGYREFVRQARSEVGF